MSMTRNQSHDDNASYSGKRPKTCAPWSDLNHDVLYLVMMKVGIGDYYSFRGVCKSWRLLAHFNKNKFIESRPPMSITISDENVCFHLKDLERRKFKTILPWFSGVGDFIGVTCGYLIFYTKETHEFRLVNPITRKEIHFPRFPTNHDPLLRKKAILVFSASISRCVFLVIYGGEIWFSIEGKGAWKHVSDTFRINDLCAFKGKIYTISRTINDPGQHECCRVCELRLVPEPKFTLLNHGSEFFFPIVFVSSCDTLYMSGSDQVYRSSLGELDVGEMKCVKPCEKTLMEEYSFFRNRLNFALTAVKRELWADPRSQSHLKYASSQDTYYDGKIKSFTAKMWYFPHQCMDVDRIDE